MDNSGSFWLGLLMIGAYFFIKYKIRKRKEQKRQIKVQESYAKQEQKIYERALKEKERTEKEKARQAIIVAKANAKAEKERQKRLNDQVTDEELEEILTMLRVKYSTEEIQ